jgi:hypothetical protein
VKEGDAKQGLRLTALSLADAAEVLASAYGRRITEQLARQVAEAGGLIRPDGTISLIEYAAFLDREATGGSED